MAAPPRSDGLSPDLTPTMVWGRSVVLGGVVAASGTLSHLLGAGRLPGPFAMTTLVVASVVLVSLFLRVRASSVRLVLVVAGGQTFIHSALSLLAGHRGGPTGPPSVNPAPVGTPNGRPERYFDHYQSLSSAVPSAPGGGDWLAHQVEHFTEQGPMMAAAHLLGAVAVALFLAVGERALWRMLLLVQARAGVRTRACALAASGHDTRHGVARAASLIGLPAVMTLCPALLDRRVRHHRGPPFVLAA